MGISPSSVLRVWRAFGLQPWRTETFKISPDPLLIDKIRDVVGLYLASANAAVFSVDEKPQIQALGRTAPVLPMMPGVPERRSFDYVRHGTVDLFAALNIATGKVISKLSAQHRAVNFRDFLDQIDRQAGPSLDIHVICDNLSAHKAPVVQKLADPRPPPLPAHFTPTYSSWINQVERWLAELQRRCLERGVFCSLDDLARQRSRTGSRPGTMTPGPSSGPRPPTRSSTGSAAIAHGSPNRLATRATATPACPDGYPRPVASGPRRWVPGSRVAGLGRRTIRLTSLEAAQVPVPHGEEQARQIAVPGEPRHGGRCRGGAEGAQLHDDPGGRVERVGQAVDDAERRGLTAADAVAAGGGRRGQEHRRSHGEPDLGVGQHASQGTRPVPGRGLQWGRRSAAGPAVGADELGHGLSSTPSLCFRTSRSCCLGYRPIAPSNCSISAMCGPVVKLNE